MGISKIVIGIDPGVTCGWAVKIGDRIDDARHFKIWELFEALENVREFNTGYTIVVEDARKMIRPTTNSARAMGAGWIRILSGQIEDFLIEKQIPHKMVAPMRNAKKLNAETVKKLTGWKEKTNSHTRDAIMIAWKN